MTTAQRLQSIINSKTAIANAIRSRGGTLADNAALATYAAAILAIPEKYPLAEMGYDSDGTLASSISGSKSKWSGKAPTASYLSMFANNSTIRVIPNLDFSKTPSMETFAHNTAKLEYVPYINADKATTLYAAFHQATSLKYHPGINAPLCTNASSIFGGSTNLEYVGELILPAATSYAAMFDHCENLVAVGAWELNNDSPDAEGMFHDCCRLRQFIAEDFAPVSVKSMFVSCTNLREVRLNLRNATNVNTIFGVGAINGAPDCAAWFNWGDDSGAAMSAIPGVKRYAAAQTTLDFRGLINWGTLHPASLQYTLENLPERRYTGGTIQNPVGMTDTTCYIYFSSETKASLTTAQRNLITSKNYTIG